MKSLIRITVAVFVLVGGTAYFGYWSTNQFDRAFDNLSAAYLAITPLVSSPAREELGLASTSPETLEALATTTAITTATTTPPTLAFIFPKKGDVVYAGCTYPISWQSSTTVTSLETILVDAGTKETIEPTTAGLARENAIEKNLQNLNWKVGSAWPGSYYIKILKINGINTEIRSQGFSVKKTEQKNICEESGGLL